MNTPLYTIALDESTNEIVVISSADGAEYRGANAMADSVDFISFVTSTIIQSTCDLAGYDAVDAMGIATEVAARVAG